jgi:hypothetical protein
MKRVAAAVIVVAGAVIIFLLVTASEDEAPIIVKNGSMTIEIEDGAWQEDGGAWSYESGKDHKGELWVRVDLTSGGPCKGTGHPVRVDYSEQGFQAIFNVVGNPARTKVSPKGQLTADGTQRLRHGASGGYITGVHIGGSQLTCDITQTNLSAISICSSADVEKCQ